MRKKNTKNMSFKKLWGKKLITPLRRFRTPAALTYFTHSTLYLHIILALPTFRSFLSELFPQFSSDQNFLTFRESNRMKRKFCRKKFRMWSRCRQVVLAFGNFRENEKVKFFYSYQLKASTVIRLCKLFLLDTVKWNFKLERYVEWKAS